MKIKSIYSNDYSVLIKRLKTEKKNRIRIKDVFGDEKIHYGYIWEDDWRYFCNIPSLNWKNFELVFARSKYTANINKEFGRYNLEFKI